MKSELSSVYTSDLEAALDRIEAYERTFHAILTMESCLLADAQEMVRDTLDRFPSKSINVREVDNGILPIGGRKGDSERGFGWTRN